VLIRIFVSLFLLSSLAPAQQAASPQAEAKFVPEYFFMAIMQKAAGFDAAKAEKAGSAHHAYWQKLADKGDLALAGPVHDAGLEAVVVYHAKDKDEAVTIAGNDPMAQQGMWTPTVLPWMTQKGVLLGIKTISPTENYFLGFLKRGDKWSPDETPERQRIQDAHLANIKKLGDTGKLVCAGPFLEDTDLRGIFVFKVSTAQEANELTNTDPAVQAGRLKIELHPWKVNAGAFTDLRKLH
jgi:uncharacterized protein YciI